MLRCSLQQTVAERRLRRSSVVDMSRQICRSKRPRSRVSDRQSLAPQQTCASSTRMRSSNSSNTHPAAPLILQEQIGSKRHQNKVRNRMVVCRYPLIVPIYTPFPYIYCCTHPFPTHSIPLVIAVVKACLYVFHSRTPTCARLLYRT